MYPIFHEIGKNNLIDIYVLYQFDTCILKMHKYFLNVEKKDQFSSRSDLRCWINFISIWRKIMN